MGPSLKKQKTAKGAKAVPASTKAHIQRPSAKVEVTHEDSENSESAKSSDEESSDIPEADSSDDEDDDEINEDDDVDVADVSSDEDSEENEEKSEGEDSESESESEAGDSESEFPLKMKKKKNKDDGSKSFATAFTAIIGSKLKAHDRKDPILARNKKPIKQLESDRLEARAKKLLSAEKKELMDRQRIRNPLPTADEPERARKIIEHERYMKKIAQKGVVRLFNAVLSTQVKTNQEVSKEKVGLLKKEELMNEISKEKFLDLVQAAGKD